MEDEVGKLSGQVVALKAELYDAGSEISTLNRIISAVVEASGIDTEGADANTLIERIQYLASLEEE